MRSFTEFLTESKKTYKFIVRVAGDLPDGFTESLKTNMEKFDVVGVSNPKKTPIQEKPLDFPQLQNMEVHHYEVEVNYPTTSHTLQEYLSQCCGVAKTHLNVRTPDEPVEQYQSNDKDQPYEAMLNTEDMGGESAQEAVAGNRVMDLLKELEVARKEREIDPVEGIKAESTKDIGDQENTKAVIGS